MTKHSVSQDVSWLAARWKAVAALAGSLVTAMLVVWPTSHALQVVIGVLGALTTGALTHQVQNAGVAPVQDTVDAVLNAVPPTLVPAVAQAVTETTTGVLATAVGTVAAVASPVGDLTGGDEH